MAICTNCGNKVPDDIKFCVSCGAALAAEGTEQLAPQLQPVSQPQSVQQPPIYMVQAQQPPVQQPAAVYTEEPITTGGYIGIFLLLMLPLINMICLIIWACGGCHKVSKRNMARAMLVWMIIGTVLSGIIVLVVILFIGSELDSLKNLATCLGE